MITVNINNITEGRFQKLLSLYNGNYEELINGMIEYKINELKRGIRNIENDFIYYEKKYNISTRSFYEKFSQGEYTKHNNDFFKWSGEYEVWQEFNHELKQIS
ncbi:MAG: hypothetical protein K8R37_11095 [Bacteroidales bacterium]|nr:hypothetical protein [Bacteroidales bacterium]